MQKLHATTAHETTSKTRSISKMLGPFASASRRYIAIHQVSLLSHASYSYSAGGVRCLRRQRQRQRVTEGTAMAPWNGPNKAAFFLERKQTDRQTETRTHRRNWSLYPRLGYRRRHISVALIENAERALSRVTSRLFQELAAMHCIAYRRLECRW